MDELQNFYAREGFVTVGLVWISMSLLGAQPFVLSGDIPNYLDAVFETVSGFTTTGRDDASAGRSPQPQLHVLAHVHAVGAADAVFVGACAGSTAAA